MDVVVDDVGDPLPPFQFGCEGEVEEADVDGEPLKLNCSRKRS